MVSITASADARFNRRKSRMILIALAIVCMLTVPLTGGRLSRLANLPLRWLWAAPAALILQIAITEVVPNVNHHTLAAVHIVSYVLVIAFLIANRRITGMWIIAVGALSNTLVIVANGGVMAASAHAQQVAGVVLDDGFHNSVVLANPRLLFLGDIIPVPGPLPNVLSPGDCVIFLGLLVLLHSQCHWRRSTAPEVVDDEIILSEVAAQEVPRKRALLTGNLAMQSLAAASADPESAGTNGAALESSDTTLASTAPASTESLGATLASVAPASTESPGTALAGAALASTESQDTALAGAALASADSSGTESHAMKGLLRKAPETVVQASETIVEPHTVVAATPIVEPHTVVAATPIVEPHTVIAATTPVVEAPPIVEPHTVLAETPVVEARTIVEAPVVVAAHEAPTTRAETYGSVLGIGGLEVSAPLVVARQVSAPEVLTRLPDVLPRDEKLLAAQRLARLTWQAGAVGAAVGFVLNRRGTKRVSPTL
jgi:hypothetical protein